MGGTKNVNFVTTICIGPKINLFGRKVIWATTLIRLKMFVGLTILYFIIMNCHITGYNVGWFSVDNFSDFLIIYLFIYFCFCYI